MDQDQTEQPDQFSLFGVTVHNHSMQNAVDWVLAQNGKQSACQTVCFVNVNSINLMASQPGLRNAINQTQRCFADGSGIRLAAKTLGIKVRENVNGTDMLPQLCERARASSHSFFLLGAAPGVAEKTAANLRLCYPGIDIVGTQHGYFEEADSAKLIEQINQSGADILLLALGSPLQEKWLVTHAAKLRCHVALAVGGLFDFYSGNLPRAPIWLRELGMEWVWRLLQEPKQKFRRYVLGNPKFLFQIYFTDRITKGW